MTQPESSEYGHALKNLQATIDLSREDLDRKGNVTKAGKKWLEELLKTFGYNPALIDKLRPEFRDLAQQIIEEHSDKPSEPGLYDDIPAESLLSGLPNHDIEQTDPHYDAP